MRRKSVSELRQKISWSLLMGAAAPIFSLMLGLLFQTAFYEIARIIPSAIRQDAHVSLPLCKIFPSLSGCEPWVGALTGLQLWELSQQVGQISGLNLNLILVAIFSVLTTVRLRDRSASAGLLIGISGLFFSILLALTVNVPLNIISPTGIFKILLLSLLPLSGWLGGRIGQDRLAKQLTHRAVYFLPGDETVQLEWQGERLSKRELEVLALVAEGLRNREIAQQLYISTATVKTHLIHIFGKLQVENRTAAVTKALACGLLREEEKETESS